MAKRELGFVSLIQVNLKLGILSIRVLINENQNANLMNNSGFFSCGFIAFL